MGREGDREIYEREDSTNYYPYSFNAKRVPALYKMYPAVSTVIGGVF